MAALLQLCGMEGTWGRIWGANLRVHMRGAASFPCPAVARRCRAKKEAAVLRDGSEEDRKHHIDIASAKFYFFCMRSTTIRIEGELLSRVEKWKAEKQSVSAFVRESIEWRLQEEKRQRSAAIYNELICENQEEAAWLTDWESADLESAPARKIPAQVNEDETPNT